jgi:hypothetical protein
VGLRGRGTLSNWYLVTWAAGLGRGGRDQAHGGGGGVNDTVVGAAPLDTGEVAGDEAGTGSEGAEVAGAGQDRRGGPDKLDGGVLAVRAGLEAGERWSGHFGQVSCTPTSNPECGEGWSGAPRPAQAPVRGVGRLGPKYRHGAGLNRSDVERMRRTNAQRLW